jgi:hypothetical protein
MQVFFFIDEHGILRALTNTKGQIGHMIEGNRNSGTSSIGEVIHKEKNQKKYNKTKGQVDKLKGYGKQGTKSTDKFATDDKQIRREANYLKNIHIDKAYEDLLRMNLISDTKYQAWYCKCLHTLGVTFVMAQADQAMKNARDRDNPAPLFHFLINKAMNKAADPYMPRFNRSERSER